ncbi:MAG: hypothetical protein ACQZ3N_09955 [cyanobacterium endosymbiont of Rhopalodia yunnanensis]
MSCFYNGVAVVRLYLKIADLYKHPNFFVTYYNLSDETVIKTVLEKAIGKFSGLYMLILKEEIFRLDSEIKNFSANI